MSIQIITAREYFLELILDSGLADNDKVIWGKLVDLLEDNELISIIECIDNQKDVLEILNKNLKSKIKVFDSQTKGDWQKILAEELDLLSTSSVDLL
jgi:hypothetical protein